MAVEGAFELGVEAFGVLAHAVEPFVLVAGGGDDAEVFAAVEPGSCVVGGGKEGSSPVVVGVSGAGQGVAAVELVAGCPVLVGVLSRLVWWRVSSLN